LFPARARAPNPDSAKWAKKIFFKKILANSVYVFTFAARFREICVKHTETD
jgi:hypothetical protein